MSFNAIRENKILAKISEFTVAPELAVLELDHQFVICQLKTTRLLTCYFSLTVGFYV